MAKRRPREDPVSAWNADNKDYDPDEVLEKIEDILEELEDTSTDVWDRAYDFLESVTEKLKGISDTIEQSGRVSRRQSEAVDNMIRGINKCLEQDYE